MKKIISEVALCSSGLRISNDQTATIAILKIIIDIIRLKLLKKGDQLSLRTLILFFCIIKNYLKQLETK